MFDLSTYRKDCAQLTLEQKKIQEMITMTERKKKRFAARPVRVALLAAALAACLGLTAFAASPAGQEMIQEFIITYTFTTKSDSEFSMTLHGEQDLQAGGIEVLSTMAYAERGGRQFLTLNGEELDVTEAMAQDGYYELEIGEAILRVTADGLATVTVYNEEGEVDMTYTVGLNEDGAVTGGSFDMSSYSYWEGEMDEDGHIHTVDGESDDACEVKEAWVITEKDGELVVTDPAGNVVDDLPDMN